MSWRSLLMAVLVISVLAIAMASSETDASPSCFDGPFEDHSPRAGPDGHPPGEDRPPSGQPVVVLDASGRPGHSPERMIEDYMGFYAEKRALEGEGRTVAILDPELAAEPGDPLSEALKAVMGCDVVSDLVEIDGDTEMSEPSVKDSAAELEFLRCLLPHLSDDGALADLVLSMISELEGPSPEFGTASFREHLCLAEAPSFSSEEACETSYDVLATPSAVQEYFCAHVFDGGAIDF